MAPLHAQTHLQETSHEWVLAEGPGAQGTWQMTAPTNAGCYSMATLLSQEQEQFNSRKGSAGHMRSGVAAVLAYVPTVTNMLLSMLKGC